MAVWAGGDQCYCGLLVACVEHGVAAAAADQHAIPDGLWLVPQRKLANEKPNGETVDYDTLIQSWPRLAAEAHLEQGWRPTNKGRERSWPFLLFNVARDLA